MVAPGLRGEYTLVMHRVGILAVFLAFVAAAHAQGGRVEIRGDVGNTSFLDDGSDNHLLVGASLRAYLTKRLSFQPEYQFLNGHHHTDSIFLANVAYDLRDSSRRVVPYLLIGAGVLQNRQLRFSNTGPFFSGGFGAKIHLNPRWYIAPDFRVGFEYHFRFSVGVGYVLRP